MRTAVVTGFDYHVGVLCRKMNAHARAWRFLPYSSTKLGLLRASLKLRNADALIAFAGPGPHPMLRAVARACRVPIFVIWAGTDVTRALEQPHRMSQAQRAEIIHLAVAPWLADELHQIGINARYIPIIGVRPRLEKGIPTECFRVLTYLPEARRDFYGRPHVYEVARRLPDVDFSIIGAGAADPSAPGNVKFFGWLDDPAPLIDQSAVLLRVPDHDGMSLVVLEALARGRFVAWKHTARGVRQVNTTDDTFRYLNELRTLHQEGRLGFNQEGLEYVTRSYEERQVSLGLEKFFETSVSEGGRDKPGRQVAISGLDIFATDVGDLNNKLQTGWRAQVLQFGSNYETAASLYSLVKSDLLYTVGTPSIGRFMKIATDILKKPRVMHWVGTDIEVARRKPSILDGLRNSSVTHLTEVEWEAEELRSLGIQPAIAPLPPRFSGADAVPPLPPEFTLLIYLPRVRSDFYGSKEVETVIRAFRGRPVKFIVVGGGSISAPPDVAIENLGWCYSLAEIYARSSALLRLTPRDGLSLMVLEALAFGRYVLWTKSFPFVTQVVTIDAVIEELDKLLELHKAGALRPQMDAVQFIQKTYDRDKCVMQIASAWNRALRRKTRRP